MRNSRLFVFPRLVYVFVEAPVGTQKQKDKFLLLRSSNEIIMSIHVSEFDYYMKFAQTVSFYWCVNNNTKAIFGLSWLVVHPGLSGLSRPRRAYHHCISRDMEEKLAPLKEHFNSTSSPAWETMSWGTSVNRAEESQERSHFIYSFSNTPMDQFISHKEFILHSILHILLIVKSFKCTQTFSIPSHHFLMLSGIDLLFCESVTM